MTVKLLTKQYLEFLSLTEGYTGSSEYTLVKMPHCENHISRLIYILVSGEMAAPVEGERLVETIRKRHRKKRDAANPDPKKRRVFRNVAERF